MPSESTFDVEPSVTCLKKLTFWGDDKRLGDFRFRPNLGLGPREKRSLTLYRNRVYTLGMGFAKYVTIFHISM